MSLHLAEAAERLVGTRYRLHGRDAATGLDCVGLVLAALAMTGRTAVDVRGYGLRNNGIACWRDRFAANAFVPAEGALSAGDLILCRPGPAQHHLAIVSRAATHFIHADAGLRRVVRAPLPLAWPFDGRWRLANEQED